jgi:hypothetical protein
MAVDWTQPLTRTLTLKTGGRLVTLYDAAELLADRFDTVRRDEPLEHAVELLLRAAETGTHKERECATDQIALVLRLRGLR